MPEASGAPSPGVAHHRQLSRERTTLTVPPTDYTTPPPYQAPPPYGATPSYGSTPPYAASMYPPPPFPGPPVKRAGLAVAALAVGGAAVVFSWVPVFGLIVGLTAVVLGAVGIAKSRRVMSIIGLVLGALAMLINVIVLAALGAAADEVSTSIAAPAVQPTTAAPATTAPVNGALVNAAPAVTDVPAPATTEATETTPPEPAYRTPTKSDFVVSVRNTSKDCFGSAGCIIDYKVKASVKHGADLDPDQSYDVTFDVRGDEDGPITGTFTVQNGEVSSYDLEGVASTGSSGTKLTVKVTNVDES